MLAQVEHALAIGRLVARQVAQQIAAVLSEVLGFLRQHARRHRRHHRIRIDLAMRMVQGDAYFGAAIFKRQHVANVRMGAQLDSAVAPHLQ